MQDQSLVSYLLHLADNALVLGHRNSEWCGHGPVLEQDIALTNISLDLLGQARYCYQYAAERQGGGATEDSLAYLRDERAFRNFLVLELPKGDWGFTVMRQFFFSQYQYLLYAQLQQSSDERIAGIAAKAQKETTYHLRWSSEWVVRLGDGTPESHARMQRSLLELWPYTGEFFQPDAVDLAMAQAVIAPNPETYRQPWTDAVRTILDEATLEMPEGGWQHDGGRKGYHTEHLGFILAEMQFLQRAYPGSQW
jgi:ring-1,2-phenylacetyl-CoA epoxidase subunit PaaC